MLSVILWIVGIFVVLHALLFTVYMFELDSAFIKNFEPTFRKAQTKYRKKKGLE